MDIVFMKGQGFDESLTKSAIIEILQAVDFLHSEAGVVHTGRLLVLLLPRVVLTVLADIHPGNVLLGCEDNSLFKKLEDSEFSNPVPRKIYPDRTIYCSRVMKPKVGPLLLSDFGEARLGPGPHVGDIMPITYRAPEVILQIQWSYAVDIWSVGLTVSTKEIALSLFR